MVQSMSSKLIKIVVKQGVVVGEKRLLPNGEEFHCFQGIPYALPPIGELRFQSPVPVQHFESPELDCTKEGSIAMQRNTSTQELEGSENCLFLNVYAPQTNITNLPVMVYIHGGGFLSGSGNSDFYYPLHLMEEGVVVVTMNYRLEAFGFLSFPEGGIYGNAGLKDQRLALQWINENITRFNGDPNNVTLFGESAGAACVHLHAYAHHANKLFHKIIMQSGSANLEWVFQLYASYKTRRLAQLLGCKSDKPYEVVRFLQSYDITATDLLAKKFELLTTDERRRGLSIPFRPVVEDSLSPDSFIDKYVMESLKSKNNLNLPTIMGYNSSEGLFKMTNILRKLPEIDADFERFVPRNLPFPNEHSNVKEVAKKMRDFYLLGRKLDQNSIYDFMHVLSDYHFCIDMQIAAELHARYQPQAPLYFYRFDYVGGRNLFKKMFQLEHFPGACHGDDIFYLFQNFDSFIESIANDDDMICTRRLCKLWTNFAKYNLPTPPNSNDSKIINFDWLPVNHPKDEQNEFVLNYLLIDRECKMGKNPDKERIEFWRNIYRTYPGKDYSKISAKL